jgi:hypothetical protein
MYITVSFPQWPAEVKEAAIDKARVLYHMDAMQNIAATLRN